MLNQKRHEIRLKNMSAIARRVYEAVPAMEAWGASFIQSELNRTGCSTGRDFRTLQGCLSSLVEAGLVLEPERGVFKRAPIRLDPTDEQPEEEDMKTAQAAKTNPHQQQDTLAHLAQLGQDAKNGAARVFAIAQKAEELGKDLKSVVAELNALSKAIDAAALDIEEQKSSAVADADKLKQLQTLLKSLAN